MKLSNKMDRVMLVVFLTIDVTCWSFQHLSIAQSCLRLKDRGKPNHMFSSNRKDNDNNSDEDWRDVRAKLVMQYSQGEDIATKGSNSTSITTTSSVPAITNNCWAYDSKGAIEVGSLIVSHPSQDSACGGLRQQHFHKCIVLVVEHSQEGTRGIILNRPTNQVINGIHQKEWKCYFGGNTEGIGSEDESLGCLYRLNDLSAVKNGMSLTILKDIGVMPWDIAQILVDEKEAMKEDFRLYRGYTKWGPGQLEKELKRDDWFTVATDIESLWNIISQDPSFSTGTDKWVQLMNRIGKGPLISSAPNQKFQDDMLKQYMRLRLLLDKSNLGLRRSTSNSRQTQKSNARTRNLVPGTLVRASTPILLDEQVFHQSLVLILKNDEDMTVGVVLNRPHSTSVSIAGTTLPLRYGGRFELDDQSMPELYLHCNHQTLQEARIGEPISEHGQAESIFWKCTRKDAETAIKAGLANANDFLIVSGLSVWKREHISRDGGGPYFTELDDYFSKVDESSIGTIWKLLKVQEPLNKNNAAENLEAANTAWMLSGDAGWMLSGSSKQFDSRSSSDLDTQEQQVVQSLAYSALDKWIRMYLLKP
jgi:putative transcriptional regulator